ncbi:MAG: protein O-mannosyl-transferase family [Myxococcota bacterium]
MSAREVWRAHGSALIAAGVWLVLLPFVHGDVSWYDAGELGAAAATLGVGHPTGFPLLTLLGHGLSLLPLGGVAFRLALLSALSVAAATGLVHATAVRAGARPLPAALGALFFPAVFVVWLHGTLVEVYALNAAWIALLAWLLLRPEPAWRVAALVTGLGLGSHATFVLSAAVLWPLTLARHGAWRRLPGLVGWGLWGALVVLYLPAAASRDPWINWGDPSTPARLLRHLTAAGIRESFAGEMGAGGASAWLAVDAWAHLAAGPLPALPLLVLLTGGLWVRGRPTWLAAVLLLGVDAVFSVVMNPMGQADLQTGVPGALALALGLAMVAGSRDVDDRTRWGLAVAVAVAVGLAAADRPADRPTDEIAGAYGRLLLAEAGPEGLVLVSSDHAASLSLYLQGVEGVRRDLVVLPKQHLADDALVRRRYAKAARRVPQAFLDVPREAQLERVRTLAREEIGERPVHWQQGDARFDPAMASVLRPGRLLYRVASSPAQAARDTHGPPRLERLLDRLASAAGTARFRSRRVVSDVARLRGVWHLLRGEVVHGAAALEDAVSIDPDNPAALLNLAAARRRQGRLPEALDLLERAVQLDPGYRKAWENLATYRAAAGDEEGAARAREMLEAL